MLGKQTGNTIRGSNKINPAYTVYILYKYIYIGQHFMHAIVYYYIGIEADALITQNLWIQSLL